MSAHADTVLVVCTCTHRPVPTKAGAVAALRNLPSAVTAHSAGLLTGACGPLQGFAVVFTGCVHYILLSFISSHTCFY